MEVNTNGKNEEDNKKRRGSFGFQAGGGATKRTLKKRKESYQFPGVIFWLPAVR